MMGFFKREMNIFKRMLEQKHPPAVEIFHGQADGVFITY